MTIMLHISVFLIMMHSELQFSEKATKTMQASTARLRAEQQLIVTLHIGQLSLNFLCLEINLSFHQYFPNSSILCKAQASVKTSETLGYCAHALEVRLKFILNVRGVWFPPSHVRHEFVVVQSLPLVEQHVGRVRVHLLFR